MACGAGERATARFLVDACGAAVGAADDGGSTPLHYALAGGYDEVAVWLLSAGADASAANGDGNIPLHYAAQAGAGASLLKRLLIAGGGGGVGGPAPASRAAASAAAATWAAAVATAASVANNDGDTPLHLAALGGHLAACELLQTRGADAGAANTGGCTPLLMASAGGHLAVVKWAHGVAPATLDQPDADGATPLEMAAAHGHADVAEWLLASGAKPTERAEAAAADKKIAKTLKRARRNAE